jgi:hypothetical protein
MTGDLALRLMILPETSIRTSTNAEVTNISIRR